MQHAPRGSAKRSAPVRVYVAGGGRLPRSILDALSRSKDDIEIVGGIEPDPDASLGGPDLALGQLLTEVKRLRPDVMILVGREVDLDAVKQLLDTRILLLEARGKQLFTFRLVAEGAQEEDVSADQFLSLVRGSTSE